MRGIDSICVVQATSSGDIQSPNDLLNLAPMLDDESNDTYCLVSGVWVSIIDHRGEEEIIGCLVCVDGGRVKVVGGLKGFSWHW
eukprot:scaffold1367_cov56-Cyclotella_meneghiniana.AAC.11